MSELDQSRGDSSLSGGGVSLSRERRRSAAPVERRISVAGGVVAYTMAGSGPPVILIHGLGGSRHTWRHLIGPLSRNHTVIALDLPGHGDSDASIAGYSPGAHASTIRDLMVGLGLPRASLVGHSLGGGIAVQFAYQFPERTSRLGLISSAGFGVDVTPFLRAAVLPGADAVLWSLGHLPAFAVRPVLSVAAALAKIGSAADAGPVSEDLSGMSDARRRQGFLDTSRAGLDRHGQSMSAAPYLGHLEGMPVLLAWGTADKIIPPHHHHELARRLPTRHVVEIKDAGHYPQDTEPTQIAGPLLAFLRSTREFDYNDGAGSHGAVNDRQVPPATAGLADAV